MKRATRRRTQQRGVYQVEHEDGSFTYVATWKEEGPVSTLRPFRMRTRVEKETATFEEACLLRAEARTAERERRASARQKSVEQLGERIMSAKWFEYRGRQ